MANIKLNDALFRLYPLAKALNREQQRQTEVICDIQSRLRDMQIGVTVFLESGLGWTKINHEWVIAMKSDQGVRPLQKCSRKERTDAYLELSALVDAISDELERIISQQE